MSTDATPDPYADPLVFGQRMQILRQRRGLTREQLGGLVARSGSWVKAVETGRLKTPALPVILRIAEVLRVRDLSDLTGNQSLRAELFAGPGHPRFAAVRQAVNAFPVAGGREAPPTAHLEARLARAWSARHAAPNHREVVGALLPDLIRDAQAAVRQAGTIADRKASQRPKRFRPGRGGPATGSSRHAATTSTPSRMWRWPRWRRPTRPRRRPCSTTATPAASSWKRPRRRARPAAGGPAHWRSASAF